MWYKLSTKQKGKDSMTMAKQKWIILSIISLSCFVSFSEAAKKPGRLDAEKLSKLTIPESYGNIDEIWLPTLTGGSEALTNSKDKQDSSKSSSKSSVSPKLVIHIRDAHCIYEAQMNIAKILESLTKRYQISLVCIEGYWGKFDPANLMVEHTPVPVREKVFNDLMKNGDAMGVEYALAVLGAPITIYGIEDKDVYEKNLQAFRSLAPHRERLTLIFQLFEHQLQDLEQKIYSEELKKFRDLIHRSEKNEITFSAYALEVLKIYGKVIGSVEAKDFKEKYPNLTLFIQKEALEKNINFEKVEKERTDFLTQISSKISGSTDDKAVSAENQKALNEFLSKTLGYRLGRVSALDYYLYLEGLIQKHYAVELKNKTFPHAELLKFIEYEKVFGHIQSKALFRELDESEDRVSESLAKTQEEKTLLKFSKNLKTLKKLYLAELNQQELADYLARKTEMTLEGVMNFLKENSKKHNIPARSGFDILDEKFFKNLTPYAEDFYTLANQRNESLTTNLLTAMEKEKVDVVILIAGGFHTEAIKSFLKEKGMGYCVITPSIQAEVIDSPYVRVMMGSKNIFEGLKTYFNNQGTIPQERGGITK